MERPRVKLNAQIYEEASTWFVESRAGDLDVSARRDLDKWLRKSPEHLSAYLEIAAIWSEGPALDASRRWDAESLIAQARMEPDNVVALGGTSVIPKLEELVPPSPAIESVAPPRTPSHHRLFALASSVAALIAVGGTCAWLAYSLPEYSTTVGEQRSIELADGSTVSMNSKSRIRVRYSKGERAIDLLEGQALFHVTKDRARPFIVSADGTRVRAVGTEFDVYEKRAGTVVTVLEGAVAVLAPVATGALRPASDAVNPDVNSMISVSAGEQVTVTPKVTRKADHANLAAATAWTERRIIFESATLSEVAEEFNRYNRRQLVIQDPQLYDFHISGMFASTDPDSLIRFLRERPGVEVIETESEIRISKNIS
jgi:transmembrane sensor